MNIHGLIWLAIGAVVTVSASVLDKSGSMTVFFWAGILMVLYGVFKLIARYATGRPARIRDAVIPSDPEISRCRNCGEPVYSTARFCHMCGAKLQIHS